MYRIYVYNKRIIVYYNYIIEVSKGLWFKMI